MKFPVAFRSRDPRSEFPGIFPSITDGHLCGYAEDVMSGVGAVLRN